MNMNSFLNSKRRGAGGIFFLFSCLLGAFIMVTVTDMSRASTIRSVSDNISHVVATKVAINSYNNGLSSFSKSGASGIGGESNYKPLNDFNNMMIEYGFADQKATEAKITWNNSTKVATIDVGAFRSSYGHSINPVKQTTTIEDR